MTGIGTHPGPSSPEVAVITGASAGVGRAAAREFARHGCKVALLARGRAGLEAAARDVEELGGEPLIVPADVADWEAVERAADQVQQSRMNSPLLWASENRGWIAAGAALALGAGLIAARLGGGEKDGHPTHV